MTSHSVLSAAQVEQLKELFEEAVSYPSADRKAFIHEACSGDDTLEQELSSLVDAHESSEGFLEKLADELVGQAISRIEVDDPSDTTAETNALHYELIGRIGRGGMGVVYKARDTRLGRTVALKFLPRRQASEPAARARLLTEARAASALDHPNIGVIYEIAESDDGRQFIAMAWYDGETLKDKIRRGPLPVAEAVEIGRQTSDALFAAHRAGIIHRDVKPANIVVTSSGAAKLLDFGIAKLMTADDGDSVAGAGTIAYMSPEQTRHATLDPRSDIWSLGVVLYETLVGQRPFKHDSDSLVIAAIREEIPAPVSSVRAEVPSSLSDIVARCLQKDPAQRYQTADDLRDALASVRFLPDDATTIVSHTSVQRRGRRLLLAGSALVLIAATATLGYRRYQNNQDASNAAVREPVSIAVLSLADSTGEDSSHYLSVGLSDDLRTSLARFRRVSVPSYVSSMAYAGQTKSVTQAAKDLSANFIVSGKVSGTNSAPIVELRMADGKKGSVVWSRRFDLGRVSPAEFVRGATEQILSEARVGLTRSEEVEIGRGATTNWRAYDLYLRGRYAELSGTPERVLAPMPADNVRAAQALYAQVRALDPQFAPNRAKLALAHMYSANSYDTTTARLDQARIEAETAIRLDPRLSDAHEAMALYWTRTGNVPNAIKELEGALREEPNNVALLYALAKQYVAAGRWEEGVALYDRAMHLDPRNAVVDFFGGTAFGRLRRNEKAIPAFNRAITVLPDDHTVKVIKGHSYLRWKGSVDTLDAELKTIPPTWDDHGTVVYGRYTVFRVRRRYQDALNMLNSTSAQLSSDGLLYHPIALMRGEMYKALGETRKARAQFEIARAVLSDSVKAHPADPSIHAVLGLTYADLGRKSEAIEEADRAMQLMPISRNSMLATAFMGIAIETFAEAGENQRALQLIELLLSIPAGREMTIPFLRVWPGFDPLRGDPRFAQLIDRFTVK